MLISLIAYSCIQETQSPTSNSNVYLAGAIENSNRITIASYWKNGDYFPLTDGSEASEVNCMAVTSSDVWIGGWDWTLLPTTGVVWRNGKELLSSTFGEVLAIAAQGTDFYSTYIDVTNGKWVYTKNGIANAITDTALNIGPTGMFIQGNDVYISGSSSYDPAPTELNKHLEQHAEYWKNGKLLFREHARDTRALAIYVNQTDVYLCGFLQQDTSSINACYWKNGELIPLTSGNHNAIAFSIFIAGTDVYIAGYDNFKAVYWKNGVAIPLTDGTKMSSANSIFVKGPDVHIGGHENYHPAYWKNNVKQSISNQDMPGQIKSVIVH